MYIIAWCTRSLLKFNYNQAVLEVVNQSAESAWHASLAEEKLTSRIAELEELLHLYILVCIALP